MMTDGEDERNHAPAAHRNTTFLLFLTHNHLSSSQLIF